MPCNYGCITDNTKTGDKTSCLPVNNCLLFHGCRIKLKVLDSFLKHTRTVRVHEYNDTGIIPRETTARSARVYDCQTINSAGRWCFLGLGRALCSLVMDHCNNRQDVMSCFVKQIVFARLLRSLTNLSTYSVQLYVYVTDTLDL